MRRAPLPLEAIHAYQHALAVPLATSHRVDVVDQPLRLRRRAIDLHARAVPAAAAAEQAVTHRVAAPLGTAFKLGFGFTAGALSVRALVALATGVTLALGLIRLLETVTR